MKESRCTAIRLLTLAVVAAAVLALTYLVSVRTAPGQRLDDLAFEGRKATFLSIRRALIWPVRFLTVPFLAAGGVVIVGDAVRRRRWGVGVVAGASILVCIGLARLLKGSLPRPELVDLAYATLLNTSPSGHAAAVVALVLAAVISCDPTVRGQVSWVGVAIVGGFSIAMTGSGWHRASDVIAGAALATTVVPMLFGVFLFLAPRTAAALTRPTRPLQFPPPRGMQALLAVALAVGALSAMAAVLAQNPPASPEHQLGPFALAVGMTGAFATTCVLVASNIMDGERIERTRVVSPSGT